MAIAEDRVEARIALFIDFENIALGMKGSKKKFDMQRIMDRLLEKGRIIVKRAYADWGRYDEFKKDLHEVAIELIEVPKRSQTGKNSADIRLTVDALDLCYTKEHLDTFVVVSGDSDFSPLVSKLKENNKHVIGVGLRGSTSRLLSDNCDEFLFYEEMEGRRVEPAASNSKSKKLPPQKQEAFALLLDAIEALLRENKDILWSSMIKDTIKRKRPSFSESGFGYRTFSELLEDAASHGVIKITRDDRSGGTYVVTEVHFS
ncbi:MAG: NYN domain-containing protein [Candidatus Eisenbacteria bacterium]|uniref:NYN domain-containing protein n=1 Tax=Eiseniibacteriota bacterium TaxID=2212470 RepID=A0A956LXN3_UNCEI|nr:NYN domain-containing protein [Candidatus Eisenbacteria bacterium]